MIYGKMLTGISKFKVSRSALVSRVGFNNLHRNKYILDRFLY